jgi:MOSC domain-containing protein YiiM
MKLEAEFMGKILAVCISKQKGTLKKNVGEADLIEDWGIKDDAHAGHWHRQVSLLPVEAIRQFRQRGAHVEYGAFGENLVVEGFDLKTLPIGSRFQCGDVLLELTQIGKKCHSHCAIYKQVGDCIMPREGVFTRVLHGGHIAVGDELKLVGGESGCGQQSLR